MKLKYERVGAVLMAAWMSVGLLMGCSSDANGDTPVAEAAVNTGDNAAAPTAATGDENTTEGRTQVIFWHSMGGKGGEGIAKMVADYNASQDEVEVVEQYQGSYNEAITKLQSIAGTDAAPDIMQLYDIGTRWMIDSGYAVQMQTLIDADGWDVSQIEPNIAGYYSVDGSLYSMPFNSSTPILYYNKDALTDAGFDAAPANWDELETVSAALTADGKVGFSMQIYGWFFEQYMSKQNLTYANNGNGRENTATAVDFDSNGGGLNLLTRWNSLYEKGLVGNLGRDENEYINAFAAGQTFMILQSTASLNTVLTAVDGAFEVGTAFLPSLDTDVDGGVSIGGGSLWMMDKGTDASKMAAWDFIKYMVEPEQQLYWHTQTGYFPITVATYELEEMQQHLAVNPQFQTAIDQLHASEVTHRGALLGVFTEARQTVEQNIEDMLDGSKTPEEAVDAMAGSINSAIENYNIANS